MQIESARFIKGIIGTDDILYNGKFQLIFLGRSNVGKSTLINSLTGKHGLARSSSSPGKTIRMDFFLINDKFYFVDFPGYGFAKRSQEKRDTLEKMMLWYLIYSEVKNRAALLIIDAKIGITEYDKRMIKNLEEQNIPYLVIANKIDNLKMGEKEKQLAVIRTDANTTAVVEFSSKDPRGKHALLHKLSSLMTAPTHG